jgi:hypothetical protein
MLVSNTSVHAAPIEPGWQRPAGPRRRGSLIGLKRPGYVIPRIAAGRFRSTFAQTPASTMTFQFDRNLARGMFLVAIALLFGVVAAFNYPVGDFARAGPGLFPILVSCLLLLVGIATMIRSHFTEKTPLTFSMRNIGLILASLCAFALVSEFVNMTAGIVTMVFVATVAGSNYSVLRNAKISVGLVIIAFIFAKFLGMNLPLY